MKIIIAGIGGVGGYFGGLLARTYAQSDAVDVTFVARGKHLDVIRRNGLKVVKGDTSFIAKPKVATDNPGEIGTVDLIMVCTKDFDLESMSEQLKPCIGKHTVILPLLNGVNSRERIQQIVPNTTVADGFVYIISRLTSPGVVENSGNIQSMYFGLEGVLDKRLACFEALCRSAGIEVTHSERISILMWEKFIFISAVATATSYFDSTIGNVLANRHKRATLVALVDEVIAVARAKEVALSGDIAERTLGRVRLLTPEATSSLHSDFKSRKAKNELSTLTGYVVETGRQLGVEVPMYKAAFNTLQKTALRWQDK